jgi:protocatechuate 3,4-dioxygenase beta subunit
LCIALGFVVGLFLLLEARGIIAQSQPEEVNANNFTIMGTVRDFNGAPLEGIRVATNFGDPIVTFDLTDATGVYTLTVITGTYAIKANKFLDQRDPPAKTVSVPPSRTQVDFTFPEHFTIRGTVRDYDGAPLQDAFVFVSGPIIDSEITDVSGGCWCIPA